MACPVLSKGRLWAAAILLALTAFASLKGGAQSAATQCSGHDLANAPAAGQKQAADLQRSVEAGPFYKELMSRFGKPKGCEVKVDGDNIALSYLFRENAHLDARINPTIEYSQQSVQFPGISDESAMALLKKGAADAFGQDGCGIDWSKPEDEATGDKPGAHATVFRGDSCNCQARVVYQEKAVVQLVVSSSC